jgi:hypothetical protein
LCEIVIWQTIRFEWNYYTLYDHNVFKTKVNLPDA